MRTFRILALMILALPLLARAQSRMPTKSFYAPPVTHQVPAIPKGVAVVVPAKPAGKMPTKSFYPGAGNGSTISGLTINLIPKASSSTGIGNSSIQDNGTNVSTSEPIHSGGVTSTGPTSITGNQTTGADQISSVNVNNILNPDTYGADPTDTIDSSAALQAAIVACNAAGSGYNVTMAGGYYKTLRPLVNNEGSCANVSELHGTGVTATILDPEFYGSALISSYGDPRTNLNWSLVSPLIGGGATHSALWSGTSSRGYFDINEVAGPQPFNGLGNWSIIAVFSDADVANIRPIWASDGALDAGTCAANNNVPGSCPSMGYLYVGADAELHGALNIAGTVYTVASGATTVSANTCYEAELNHDNTGHNVNLFLGPCGGTIARVAQTAATGTITQKVYENNTIGADLQNWPFYYYQIFTGTNPLPFWDGTLGPIQILNVARDTGTTFAGDSSLTGGSSTLFLMDFSGTNFPVIDGTHAAPIVQVSYTHGQNTVPSWMELRDAGHGPSNQPWPISDFTIYSGGKHTIGIESVASAVQVARVMDWSSYIGMYTSLNASYYSSFRDVNFGLGARTADLVVLGGLSTIDGYNRFGSSKTVNVAVVTSGPDLRNAFPDNGGADTCSIDIEEQAFGSVHLDDVQPDLEASGTCAGICVRNVANGVAPVLVTSSFLDSCDSTATLPAVKLISGADTSAFGPITFDTDLFNSTSNSTIHGMVDTTELTTLSDFTGPISFNQNTYVGGITDGTVKLIQPATVGAIYCKQTLSGSVCYSPVGGLIACTAALDHVHVTVTNANASCSAGTTAAAGGSTSCDEYCAGASTTWKETGF